MKRLRVLVLMHPDLVPPDSLDGHSEQEINNWKTEYDVVSTLRAAGHDVRPLGVQDELKPIRDEIESWKPDVVFNLLEQFHGEAVYDQNVASYLELMRVPYTGCNPRGLVLARGKDLSKKLLAYHRIPLPAFAVFPLRRKVKRPARLGLPLIVKSLNEDASWGIAQASVVDSDEKLAERVTFIHERIGTRRHRRAIHRGPRALCRRAGQRAAARLPDLGAGVRQHGAARASDRHREGQARPAIPGTPRHRDRAGEGPPAAAGRRASRAPPSGSIGRWSSTAMPASISACPPTASRITSRPIPIPRSPGSRSSRQRPCMTALPIPICCTGSWRSA